VRLRLIHGPSRAAIVALCLVSALGVGGLAGCAAGRAASDATRSSHSTIGPGEGAVRVMQLNLCNSGRARCYTGRSVGMAVSLIPRLRPTMVSVNEVCRDDVRVLEQALAATFPEASVATAFTAARDRATQAAVRCENGRPYGDGVLVVSSSTHDVRSYHGVYPVQDPRDVEERVWVCVDVATRFAACTTHTASTSPTVAADQCRHLLSSALPAISRRNGDNPIILGADLNLVARASPGPQSCLPDGYQRADDGDVQDVVVSPGIGVRSRSVIDMDGTTDHPALVVDVALTRR
jgi:hypothetical protein